MTGQGHKGESGTEVTIPGSEVHYLRSEIVGQEYKLQVATPEPQFAPGETYPVLYLLDANASFGLVTDTVRLLQMAAELPPIIIVGIGYPVRTHMETMFLRLRDYMPSRDWRYELVSTQWKQFAAEAVPGGAENFLKFIDEELKPFIQAKYPADPNDATLIGSSAGGTFGLYVLFHRPESFQRYVIGSPPFSWDDEVVFKYEEQYAQTHDDLPARVFMGAGGQETEAEFLAQLKKLPQEMREAWEEHGHTQIVELMGPMMQMLRGRNYPGLTISSHLFDDENHTSVVPALFSRGLRVVYQ